MTVAGSNRSRSNVAAILFGLFCFVLSDVLLAEIRLYRMRKDGNVENLHFVRGTDKLGCHNLSNRRKVHQVGVIDFAHCSLYTTDDCKPGTEIPAYWKKKPDRKETKLTEGTRWFTSVDGNVKVSAWQCFK